MKRITESENEHKWPRQKVDNVECRKRDLVVRIADWIDDKSEPAIDVECYIGGVYDWNESKCFTLREFKSPEECKKHAIDYARTQMQKLL